MANMQQRQTRYSIYLVTYLIVILAVIVRGQLAGEDLQQVRRYHHQQALQAFRQTEKVVKNLKKPVKVYYFDKTDAIRPRTGYRSIATATCRPTSKSTTSIPTRSRIWLASKACMLRRHHSRYRREEGNAKSLTEEELTGALIASSRAVLAPPAL